jgi:hypothetical protein
MADPYSWFNNITQSGTQGASLGSMVPGIGTGIGAAAGVVLGIAKSILQPKAKMPPLEDPSQVAYLDELNRKRKALNSGADYNYQLANQQAQKGLATTQNAVLKSGSDIGSVLTGLNMAQQNAGNQMNNATSYLLNKQEAADKAYGESIDAIAARKLSLQFNQYLQALRTNSESSQAGGQNMMGGLAYLMGHLNNNSLDTGYSNAMNTKINTPYSLNSNTGGMNNWSLKG